MDEDITLEGVKLSCSECSLSELCLPRGLTSEEVVDLEGVVEQKPPLSRNQTLYRSGDPFVAFYAVKSGGLKTTIVSRDGEEQIIGFHIAGDLVGFDGLATERYACDCMALQRTTVCELPVGKLEQLCNEHPSLRREMYYLMGKTINDDQSMLLQLARRTADERLASFLFTLSQRHEVRGYSAIEFELPMTMRDIANYLGLAPETLSRLIAKFTKEKIIDTKRNRVQILSLERLESMVAECSNG